ncbi:hypothetical protein C482_06582 [Natrialba chahannaoensis JCM 10990]|uniref:DUF7577 domain-containing protein n=1 Tax=Natrialba chahannaoensis JCM 10990 TaxID=1227492 RepID=M0ATN8_9EURY|nr:hypothetical protein [Natrialba chahannaoensis]ELZ01697.1 hypothetical protein C482_06582 [Natrialba chahannaoensis JCM 10990]
MELWGWLIGYVVLFALLHLLLYYVYVRREDSDGTGSPSFADPNRASSRSSGTTDRYPTSGEKRGGHDPPPVEDDHEVDGESIRCRHCGAENAADKTYTYCWNCVTTLRQPV